MSKSRLAKRKHRQLSAKLLRLFEISRANGLSWDELGKLAFEYFKRGFGSLTRSQCEELSARIIFTKAFPERDFDKWMHYRGEGEA